jgi:hypothetical protein
LKGDFFNEFGHGKLDSELHNKGKRVELGVNKRVLHTHHPKDQKLHIPLATGQQNSQQSAGERYLSTYVHGQGDENDSDVEQHQLFILEDSVIDKFPFDGANEDEVQASINSQVDNFGYPIPNLIDAYISAVC